VRKVDIAGEAERIVGEDADALALVFDGDGPPDAQVTPLAAEKAREMGIRLD
jgi:hypothetical protein